MSAFQEWFDKRYPGGALEQKEAALTAWLERQSTIDKMERLIASFQAEFNEAKSKAFPQKLESLIYGEYNNTTRFAIIIAPNQSAGEFLTNMTDEQALAAFDSLADGIKAGCFPRQ